MEEEIRQDVLVQKCGTYNMVRIGDTVINNVKDYKIISSADGATELIIHISVEMDKATFCLSAN